MTATTPNESTPMEVRSASPASPTDPETYRQIVVQADRSDAERAAHRDPDAYIALFIAAANDLPQCPQAETST